MTAPDPAFLRRVAASIRYCDYGPIVNQYAEAQAARFDAQADELEARERLAIDIGLVATEASEGVAYGSEPDDFFRAAGEAVLCWLPLNGWKLHAASSEPVAVHVHHHDIEAHAASFNEGYDEAVRQLAEPAEEETKAETCAVRLCVLPARHSGVHADREGLRWNTPTSSPVVPAPTETGPWQTVGAIPESVTRIKDCEGDEWHRCIDGWEHGGMHGPGDYAPFVAAEER